ncbi:MAG: rod shape-determining protein MreD [Nitrospinae bacterium]|nr:rod shape-determining protein MreD [Nitrospinota bacterium]
MIVLIFIIVFILLFALQTSLLSHFSVGGVTLDLALILSVYCGVLLRGDRGIWVGFSIGLVQDCLSGSLLGVNTLSKSIIGFTFSRLKDKLMVEGFVPISVILLAASFFDGLVYYLALTTLLKAQIPFSFLFNTLPVYAMVNALVGPILFFFLNWSAKRILRKFPLLEGTS